MGIWAKNPYLYEVHTWQWLHELSQRSQRKVDLSTVPPQEWDRFREMGMDAVWLMGVFERSPQSRQIARNHPGLHHEFSQALPDFTSEDVVGSPYSIRSYQVDAFLGGEKGLADARQQLAARGIALLLDFVPNHTSVDNPWLQVDPDCYIRGDLSLLRFRGEEWFKVGANVFAHGKDPYFPAWTDTAQLNAFSEAYRTKAISTLKSLAQRCDGVRCDMAMLMLTDVFERTWQDRAGRRPPNEFWQQVIAPVRRSFPDFLFVAEAYWNTEPALLRSGFDYCYDKTLYDLLARSDSASIRHHLATAQNQASLVRFIENHDEPRAAATFGSDRLRMATLAFATLPGMRLFHHGQHQGRRTRMPVQLGRCLNESEDPDHVAFHDKLLRALQAQEWRTGNWQMLNTHGWPDNWTHQNLLTWSWSGPQRRWVVVINLSDGTTQARVELPWKELAHLPNLVLRDMLSGEEYVRNTAELLSDGLFVSLKGWQAHLLCCETPQLSVMSQV